MIEGEDGDVYCEASARAAQLHHHQMQMLMLQACWHSFMFHNPDLEGLWEAGAAQLTVKHWRDTTREDFPLGPFPRCVSESVSFWVLESFPFLSLR